VVLKKIIQQRMVAKQGRSTGTVYQREQHTKPPGREARRSACNAKAQRRALRHGGGRRSRPLHPPGTNR